MLYIFSTLSFCKSYFFFLSFYSFFLFLKCHVVFSFCLSFMGAEIFLQTLNPENLDSFKENGSYRGKPGGLVGKIHTLITMYPAM